jgi:hypothetical protein
MRLIVNHLTRMKLPHVCVAGIDPDNKVHVRPVAGQLARTLTVGAGGPFGIGALVEIGAAQPCGSPPETEDVLFVPVNAHKTADMPPDQFWAWLKYFAKPKLAEIFGPAIHRQGHSFAVDLHQGVASLGCWNPPIRIDLSVNQWNKIAVAVTLEGERVYVPVTDLRLYEEDQATPRHQRIAELANRISRGTDVILSVGLARKFKAQKDTEERHWLQVNNVHVADEPIW